MIFSFAKQRKFDGAIALVVGILFSTVLFPLSASASLSDDDYYGPRRLVSVQNQLTNVGNTPSGAFTHDIPITIPPGRNGLQPDLKFSYNSQNKDKANLFGYGWDVAIPYIQRNNKTGTEKLYTDHYFISSMSGELEDISLSDGEHGTYGAKVDDGSFLKYEYATSTDAWTVTDKSGTVYTFGSTASTRQDDPSDNTRIYKWMLEEVRDQNDNYVEYTYYKEDGQIYPDTITYTGNGVTDGIYDIVFLREARDDDYTSYASGFEVGTNYRIDEVQVKVDDAWVRKYELAYTTGDNTKRSLLSSITETGRDESLNTIALPAHSFTYQSHDGTWTEDTAWTVPITLKSTEIWITDITGDNLPDIIHSNLQSGTHYKTIWINNGVDGWTDETSSWTLPTHLGYNGHIRHEAAVIDVDGDGFADIVITDNNVNDRKVYLNNGDGTGWTEDTGWDIPFVLAPSGSPDHAVRMMDVNGDGLIDVVRADWNVSEQEIIDQIFINDGDGTGWTEDTDWTTPIYFSSGGTNYALRMFDVNGDGLTDIVRSESNLSGHFDDVYINNGKDGWDEDTNYAVPFAFENNGQQQRQIEIHDLNGDGLLDFLDADGAEQYRKVYLNKGDGTGWVQDTNYSIPVSIKSPEKRAFDVDGDGLIDFLSAETVSSVMYDNMYENDGAEVDLLSQITTSDGAIITPSYEAVVDYRDSTGDSLNTLPFSFDTVDQIVTNDGLGNTTTESFSYEGGEYYYNSELDRKFSGFHKIITTDPDSNVTKEFYHQGNTSDSTNGENSDDVSKIGFKYRTEQYDDASNKYTQSVEKWENYDLNNDRDFVKRTRLTEYSYDGDASHKDKVTEWTYDNTYGNVTQEVRYGEVTTTTQDGTFTDTGSDKFTTDTTYALNTTDYIVGLTKQETLKDQSNNTVADTKFYYDSQAHGTVNDGNLTKQEQWETGGTWIDNEWTYNSYGLVTQEKDPRNKATNYTYDSDNLYPTTVTNAKGQVTTYTYDYSSGEVKVTTDPNTRQFETTYDALDRPKLVKVPDLSSPTTLVTQTEYIYTDTGVPRKTQVRQYLDGSTNSDTYVYVDGLGRSIQERVEAEDSNTYSVTDFVYGDNGLVQKESLPYFSTGSARTTPTTNNYLYTTYTYDALDRVKTAVNTLGTTSYSYDDWETVTTDTESNTKDTHVDAHGNLVKVEENNGASTYTTNYEYNGLGNLTKVTDAASNVRNFTYDGLGNRLTAEDLHASADVTFGTWTYTYDDAGNVTRVVDAKNQTIDYTYDDLNRVLTEDYTGDSGTEVSYTYDVGTNGKGHLTSVTRGGITTAYAYNAVGEVDTETRTVNSTDYVTEYDYDRQGNITLLTYPDDAEIQNTYNTAGQLEKVERKESGGSFVDAITDLDYGPHGNVVYKDYGNNVVSYYTYDPEDAYRLKNITTIDPEDEELTPVTEALATDEEPIVEKEIVIIAPDEVVEETVKEISEEVVDEVVIAETATSTPAVEENTTIEEVATTTSAIEQPEEQTAEGDEEEVVVEAEDSTATQTDISKSKIVEQRKTNDSTDSKENTEEQLAQEDTATSEEQSDKEVTEDTEAKVLKEEEEVIEQDEYEPLTSAINIAQHGEEKKSKRTRTSLTYKSGVNEEGKDVFTTRSFAAPVHYKTAQGWEPIDTRLRKKGDKLAVTKAEYGLEINEGSDQDFTKFSVGDLWVTMGLREQQQKKFHGYKEQAGTHKNRKANFKNILGNGIHLELRPENEYVAKDIIFEQKSALKHLQQTDTHYEVSFNLDVSEGTEIHINDAVLSEVGQELETNGVVTLTNGKDTAYIYPALVEDSNDLSANISVRYAKTETGFILTKLLPKELMDSATYPVRSDAVVSYYAGNGDGMVYILWKNEWSDARDGTSGNNVNYTSGDAWVSTFSLDAKYAIDRAFFPIDTSALPTEAIISDATLSLYIGDVKDNYNDSHAYVAVVEGSQSSTSSLENNDFDNVGTTKGSSDYDLGSLSTNQYNDFDLNSTGIGWIDNDGWTKLALREGHDLDDEAIDPLYWSTTKSGFEFKTANEGGTDKDPYLEITYTVNYAPTVPTSPQTEGTSNPVNVTDGTPEFTAIYDDPDTSDTAEHYQIQVIADGGSWTSPLWDSTKTALTATTTEGTRSEEISYGGTALSENGAKYYWRIKFWDNGGAEGAWSDGLDNFTMAGTPTAPTSLYSNCITAQSGSTNPTGLKCGTPVFSAVFDDNGSSPVGKKYRVQLGTVSDFQSGIKWDSGSSGTAMSDVADGTRSADIVYNGEPLNYDDTTYYWRIKFWNDSGNEGGWSTATSTFSTYDSEIFQDVHYTYDTVGNITKIVDSSDTSSAKTVDYTYDDLYRLTAVSSTLAATSTDYSRTYAYDSIGNFTNKSDIGNYSYSGTGKANPHAATTVGSATYTYDDNGNLTDDGTRTYTWNYDNTVATVVKSGTTYAHTYDHDGQRVSTNDGTTTTTFANRYYETDGTNTTKYIYAGDELVATIDDDTTNVDVWYVHPDHLKSTAVLTNASSTEAQAIDYFPFGEVRVNEDTDSVNITRQFTGYELDDSDLNYAGARYYVANAGKWVSQDPVFQNLGIDERTAQALSDPQSQNSYSYVRNNPLRLVDENGEWFKEVLTGQQSFSDFQIEVGDAAEYLYNNDATYKTAMDHPHVTSAVLAAGGAYSASVAATSLATGVAWQSVVGLINSAGILEMSEVGIDFIGQQYDNKLYTVQEQEITNRDLSIGLGLDIVSRLGSVKQQTALEIASATLKTVDSVTNFTSKDNHQEN